MGNLTCFSSEEVFEQVSPMRFDTCTINLRQFQDDEQLIESVLVNQAYELPFHQDRRIRIFQLHCQDRIDFLHQLKPKLIVQGSQLKSDLVFWRIDIGKVINNFRFQRASIYYYVQYKPCGRYLGCIMEQEHLRLIVNQRSKVIRKLIHKDTHYLENAYSLIYVDSKLGLAIYNPDKNLEIWHLASGQVFQNVRKDMNYRSISYCHQKQQILSVKSRKLQQINVKDCQIIKQIDISDKLNEDHLVAQIVHSPNGRQLLMIIHDNETIKTTSHLRVFDSNTLIQVWEKKGFISSCQYTQDSKFIVSCFHLNAIILDAMSGVLLMLIQNPSQVIFNITVVEEQTDILIILQRRIQRIQDPISNLLDNEL